MAQRGIRIEKIIEYETTLPHFCKNQVRIVLTDFVQRSLPILQVQKSKDELHDFLLFFLQENLWILVQNLLLKALILELLL